MDCVDAFWAERLPQIQLACGAHKASLTNRPKGTWLASALPQLHPRQPPSLPLKHTLCCRPCRPPAQVTGTVHETGRGAENEAERYGVPKAKGIFKCVVAPS